jgi:hypothetical protein
LLICRPSLRLRRKEGSFSTLSLFDPLSAAGEERVVDPLKAEQTGPKDSFGGESMGRVQLMRQFEMHPLIIITIIRYICALLLSFYGIF